MYEGGSLQAFVPPFPSQIQLGGQFLVAEGLDLEVFVVKTGDGEYEQVVGLLPATGCDLIATLAALDYGTNMILVGYFEACDGLYVCYSL